MSRSATRSIVGMFCLCALALSSGCSTYAGMRGRALEASSTDDVAIKPVVAVMDFDNRANFSGKWNLGDGMAELMVAELIDSGRFTVLERRHLRDLLDELVLQGQGFFRKEGQVEKGRLKNAKYMIHGTVTDFTVTGDISGWFGASKARLFGGGSKARVAMVVNLSEVESGEILASAKTFGKAGSGFFGGKVDYKDVSFGGDAYFKTPLGKATSEAMAKAVRRIVQALPEERWIPRIAEADVDTVIINGGQNTGIQAGDVFIIRTKGRTVTDPITGDAIDSLPGKVVGRVEVKIVKPFSAHAILLDGEARRGDFLEYAP